MFAAAAEVRDVCFTDWPGSLPLARVHGAVDFVGVVECVDLRRNFADGI
jgi:hypothetical protein